MNLGISFACLETHSLMSRFACSSKIAIFRVLRNIVSLTIFCVARDVSLFFVMLITTKPERVADLTKFAKIHNHVPRKVALSII